MKSIMTTLFASALIIASAAAPSLAAEKDLSAKERDYLQRALDGNHAELMLGQLGSRLASSPEVKKSADKMVEKHGALDKELMGYSKEYGLSGTPSVSPEAQATHDRLSKLSGPAFDQAFKQAVDSAHARELALQNDELASGTNPDLRNFAQGRVTALKQNPTPFKAAGGSGGAEKGW